MSATGVYVCTHKILCVNYVHMHTHVYSLYSSIQSIHSRAAWQMYIFRPGIQARYLCCTRANKDIFVLPTKQIHLSLSLPQWRPKPPQTVKSSRSLSTRFCFFFSLSLSSLFFELRLTPKLYLSCDNPNP